MGHWRSSLNNEPYFTQLLQICSVVQGYFRLLPIVLIHHGTVLYARPQAHPISWTIHSLVHMVVQWEFHSLFRSVRLYFSHHLTKSINVIYFASVRFRSFSTQKTTNSPCAPSAGRVRRSRREPKKRDSQWPVYVDRFAPHVVCTQCSSWRLTLCEFLRWRICFGILLISPLRGVSRGWGCGLA